jgi:hypothetical protein
MGCSKHITSGIPSIRTMKLLLLISAVVYTYAPCIAQSTASKGIAIERSFGFSTLLANAKLALSAQQYAGANGMFKEAFRIRAPWDSYSYIRASVAAYMASDTAQAWDMLYSAVATGATWTDIEEGLMTIPVGDKAKFVDEYKRIRKRASAEFSCSIDLEQYCLVKDLLTADQVLRNIPQSTILETKYLAYMGSQDSLGFVSLVRLVENNGWPTFSKIGNLNSLLPLLLMHNIGLTHASEQDWEVIRNAVRKSVLMGEEDGYVLALIEDLFLQRKDEPQLYGTQSTGWESTPTYYAIKDCNFVDVRRRELGLVPLELDAKRRELLLPACYIK